MEFGECASYSTEKGFGEKKSQGAEMTQGHRQADCRKKQRDERAARYQPPGETRASDYSISSHPGLDGRHVHFRESDFSDNYAASRNDTPFVWTSETQEAFDDIKKAILNPPVLALPDQNAELQITTDASSRGIGAVSEQKYPNSEVKPLYFF
ncbi:transposon Tf2-9 polyprotein [Trichonephila clavipes]|nr:transposon Tf2-9 polyprotein [Trichonephila clavipes]